MTVQFSEGDCIDQLRGAMRASGIDYLGPILPDGVLHRIHVEGDSRGSRHGWYVLHPDGRPTGVFGSMKTGQKVKWSARGVQALSRAERDSFAQQAKARAAEQAAAERIRWEVAASLARAMWEAATPAEDHPYLSRKGVASHGLRVGDFIRQLPPGPNGEVRSRVYPGALLIPLWDGYKDIWNLQAIFPTPVVWSQGVTREKAFIYGARKQKLWYAIGKPASLDAPVALVEGYATGATVHAASGLPVLIAFDAGNLVHVAKELRRLRPEARLLVAADDDRWSSGGRNVGMEKGALAATLNDGELICPRFGQLDGKPTDFNDLQQAEGLDAVKRQFEERLRSPAGDRSPGDGVTAHGQPRSEVRLPSSEEDRARAETEPATTRRPMTVRTNLGDDRLSEDAMAELLAGEMQERLRYCHSEGLWFIWTQGIWRRDKMREAHDIARQAVRRMTAQEQKPEKYRSSRFVGGVMSFASGDPRLSRDSGHWDRDGMLLGTPAEVIDLSTGHAVPPDPEHGITRATSVSPAATADCPNWLKFLQQATGGDQDTIHFLKRFFGSCLTGETRDQTLLFIHGDGGNGKGVFIDVIREILGDYAATATTDMLMEAKFPKHSTDLAMLKGARLAVASETDQGTAWAESRIKQMTGSDPITARFMRQDNFTYLPQFKLVVIGNHMPALKNVDAAMRRRFRVVPFTHKPASVDKFLRDKLRAEAPAILRWLLDGCVEWQREGLGGSMIIDEATHSYLGDQDLHAQWLSESCVTRQGDRMVRAHVSDLYDSFSSFAKQAGEEPGSRKAFSTWLVAAGFERCRDSKVRMMSGVRLRTSDDR